MVQVLYSIAAIMLLGITVLNINVKIHGTEERMMLSELSLEMTSIGAEILNEIGRLEYDQSATFGQVLPVASLETLTVMRMPHRARRWRARTAELVPGRSANRSCASNSASVARK